MQHKSLFAAMMLGALVLASCVKNEESQSVKDIRRARAEEIRTQAELNMANVQATITLANAQAAIAAAEAKLKEAEAAIAMAEAAKKLAEAELIEVQVQIAQVQLQEEQVKLLAKRAELEKLIAQYEAEIAQYEADKQEALNRLAQAEAAAVLDNIKMQEKLLKDEADLLKAAAKLGEEKEKQINAIWNKYTAEMTALGKAQEDLIKAQIKLAKLEAGEETAMDILADQIIAKQIEVATQKAYINELESRVDIDEATLQASLLAARAAWDEALTKKSTAATEYNALKDEFDRRRFSDLAYEEGWRDGNDPDAALVSWFEGLPEDYTIGNSTTHVFKKGVKKNPDTGRLEQGVYFFYQSAAAENQLVHKTFIPLYTADDYDHNVYSNWFWDNSKTYRYPGYDGAEAPVNWGYVTFHNFVPAKIYTENFGDFIDLMYEIEMQQYEGQFERAEDQYNDLKAYIEARMAELEEEMAVREAYVTAAKEEVEAAIAAIAEAKDNEDAAKLALDLAAQNYHDYANASGASSAAKKEARAVENAMDAFEDIQKAQEAVEKARVVLFGVTDEGAVAQTSSDEEAPVGLISRVKSLEQVSFESAKAYAEAQVFEKAAKDTCDAHTDLETAWNDAKAELADTAALLAPYKKAAQDKLEEYHKAILDYTVDTTKKAEMLAAEKVWKEADSLATVIQTRIPVLEGNVAQAYDAWYVYYGPYIIAQSLTKVYESIALADFDAWQDAKKKLGSYDDPVTAKTAFGRFNAAVAELGNPEDDETKNTAYGKYQKRVKELEEAIEQVPEGENTTELIALRIAWHEAENALHDALKATREAKRDLVSLIGNPEVPASMEHAKYPTFIENLLHILPVEGEAFFADTRDWKLYPVFNEKMPGQNYAQYVWYGEMLEELEDKVWADITANGAEDIYKKFMNLRTEVTYFEQIEPEYLDYLEDLQDMADRLTELYEAYIDAQNEAVLPESAYTAIKALVDSQAYVVDGQYMTVKKYEETIEAEKKKLIKLEAELTELLAQMQVGVLVQIPGQEAQYAGIMKANLELEIAKLENELELRAALIEQYLEILTQLLGGQEVE